MARLNEKVKRVNLDQTQANATFFDRLIMFKPQKKAQLSGSVDKTALRDEVCLCPGDHSRVTPA